MPNTAAIVYAKNSKKGSYTGFFHDIKKSERFDHQKFLAKHALAGPKSRIRCLIMPLGLNGNIMRCSYMKETDVCQIPNFSYSYKEMADLPKPK